MDNPLSDADTEAARESYGEGALSQLVETGDPGVLDVVYQSDPRFSNFEKNISVSLTNVYVSDRRVYVALSGGTYPNGPGIHFIANVVSPRQFKVECKFSILPSPESVRAESKKIPSFNAFDDVVSNIMGGGGDCGTMNAPARAMGELREGLESLIVRPWTYTPQIERNDSAVTKSADTSSWAYSFANWGYLGAWNYRKLLEYNAILPKVQLGLAEKYMKDYGLTNNQALALARAGLYAILANAFAHGDEEDEFFALREALLSGKSAEEVSALLPKPESMNEKYGDSLLVFALGHPRLVELLLKRGFDPNKVNAFGKTPLMYAAQFNDLASAKLLVARGANPQMATTKPGDTCSYTIVTNHVTALHYAVRYASRDFIAWLVGIGAVTSAQDSHGHTPHEYLVKFGGFVGYEQPAELSYGKQNGLLDKSQFVSLEKILKPVDDRNRQSSSDEANLQAEAFYRAGDARAAYSAEKKALAFNAKNERALANMSLIALRLGSNGESAKAADYLIKNATSDKERAAAYFNLGLACDAEGRKGYHYSAIGYDGERYCQEKWNRYQGPLFNYLKAYGLAPTEGRANAIIRFFEEQNVPNGKWLCKAAEPGSNPRVVYVTNSHVYFFKEAGRSVSMTLRHQVA